MNRSRTIRTLGVASVFAVGCATSQRILRVDPGALETLSEPERVAIEQHHQRQIAGARDEHRRAAESVIEARETLACHVEHGPASITPRVEDAQSEREIAAERQHIREATASWLRARLRWRERVQEASDLHLAVTEAAAELAKAEAVASRNQGGDAIELAAFRSQFAHTHEDWSAARARVAVARADSDRALDQLNLAKGRFARLKKARS